MLKACQREANIYLRLEARDEVTTVPALAQGGEPSTPARLLRGENADDTSESALPRFPTTPPGVRNHPQTGPSQLNEQHSPQAQGTVNCCLLSYGVSKCRLFLYLSIVINFRLVQY